MAGRLLTMINMDGFRPRGTEVTRIEAFSDAVFGFALTLLVVALEVPKSYEELHAMLSGFLGFALCFLVFISVWLEHYRFFRRFGLQDVETIYLNAVLLFVVLFYVYPLKFVFYLLGGLAIKTAHPTVLAPEQSRELLLLYGVGVAAVYGLIALLNYQGWRQRKALELTPREELLTRFYILDASVNAGLGLLAFALAYLLPVAQAKYSSLAYALAAVLVPVNRVRLQRRLKKMPPVLLGYGNPE